MFIFLAILAAGGVISVLFAGFLYYGITGVLELIEVCVIVLTVALYYLYNTFGPGAKVIAKERKEKYDANVKLFGSIPIHMDDGRILQPGTYLLDRNGLPILD